jgi:hypothetical protein
MVYGDEALNVEKFEGAFPPALPDYFQMQDIITLRESI